MFKMRMLSTSAGRLFYLLVPRPVSVRATVDGQLDLNREHCSWLQYVVTLSVVDIHAGHKPLQLECHVLH